VLKPKRLVRSSSEQQPLGTQPTGQGCVCSSRSASCASVVTDHPRPQCLHIGPGDSPGRAPRRRPLRPGNPALACQALASTGRAAGFRSMAVAGGPRARHSQPTGLSSDQASTSQTPIAVGLRTAADNPQASNPRAPEAAKANRDRLPRCNRVIAGGPGATSPALRRRQHRPRQASHP